ncbi:glycosyltransferase family 2 protein [Carboxylicivirga sp. RSCT41]|uniref:glycosyltransferase family 2 protein n=1 Tax=Carboxylicivirga agarovorans TaxID=3417570 RepID=UPI003D32520A
MPDCTVIILTYKGKHHLEHLLPTVKDAIEVTSEYDIDVLIVDNGRDEATKNFVIKNYPSYQYIFSPVNDYLFSLNSYIKRIKSEFVLILNDDLKLTSSVFKESIPLLKQDDQLFAVTAKIYNWDGVGVQNGVRQLKLKKGWVESFWIFEDISDVRYTFYASGGAGLFRVKYFNDLNGFDDIFRPAYIEEVDLSHRAWHRGWRTIYNPKFKVFHRDAGTISTQFKSSEVAQMFYRNFFLWQFKSMNSGVFWIQFLIKLPFRYIYWLLKSKNLAIGFNKALGSLHLINKNKKRVKTISDCEIINYINTPYKTK